MFQTGYTGASPQTCDASCATLLELAMMAAHRLAERRNNLDVSRRRAAKSWKCQTTAAPRFRPRPEQMHLQTVGVNDRRSVTTQEVSQTPQIEECRCTCQNEAHQQQERRPHTVNTPITKPGQRRREREDFDWARPRPTLSTSGPSDPGDKPERPGRMRVTKTGQQFVKRGFGPANLAGWREKKDAHRSRCRTTIVSPALTRSVGLASNSLRLSPTTRTMRRRLFDPRSMMPPAVEMACRTVMSRSRT